jgi:chemotaxis protein methyltransferase CheR
LEVNRGLPTALLLKWFQQDGASWQLDERIRSMVTFAPLNLAQAWPAMPKWDLVFLRNVMIYFDNSVKTNILGRVARVLSPDGYLLLGGAETTLNLDNSYFRIETLKSGFYKLKPA